MLETPFSTESRGHVLRGVLHDPGDRAFPVVVICHGYFQSNRIGPMALYVQIARALAASGIGCVRFDFSGFGESDGDYLDVTYDTFLQDLTNVVTSFVSPIAEQGRIGLLGHSLGGNICIGFAARNPSVKSVCLLSPNPVRSRDDVTIFSPQQLGELEHTGATLRKGIPASERVYRPIHAGTAFACAAHVKAPTAVFYGTEDPYYSASQYERLAKAFPRCSSVSGITGADHNYLPLSSRRQLIASVVGWYTNTLISINN